MQWSEVFEATGEGPGVYAVASTHREAVLGWAVHRGLPAVVSREIGAPAVDAWGVLDGGVLRLHRHGRADCLAPGVRVVGWWALRLAARELDLTLPDGPLHGEPGAPPEYVALRRRAAVTVPPDPALAEQAEMLATCTDTTTLRWVAKALASTPMAPTPRPAPTPTPRPAPSPAHPGVVGA